MMTSRKTPSAVPPKATDPRDRQFDDLCALVYRLLIHSEEIDRRISELCAAAGLDPLPPEKIEARNFRRIKQVAGATGYSETWVRQQIASGRFRTTRLGGKILIDADSVSAKKRVERTLKPGVGYKP
jgi:hypothetical protein